MASEFDLITRYFDRPTPLADLGPGDDCALLPHTAETQLAITKDMLVAGTHFFAETDPFQLGWKTLAVNLSDLAAMGSKPKWVMLALSLPEANEVWLDQFSKGLLHCAQVYEVDLVGGDTTRGPLTLCITALGEVPKGRALCRHHAKPGDDIWISGTPGLASLGLLHLQKEIQLNEDLAKSCIEALQRPIPRVELGLALQERSLAHAAIDVSDGLLADLGHIAKRSNVTARILIESLPSVPREVTQTIARQCQLTGGDDYELIFTAPSSNRDKLFALSKELDLPLWKIGRMEENTDASNPQVLLTDASGQILPIGKKGFDHFG